MSKVSSFRYYVVALLVCIMALTMVIPAFAEDEQVGVILFLPSVSGGNEQVRAADNIPNNLDASIDAEAEVMPLTVGGANGTTHLYVDPTNGDGKQGCNLTGGTSLVVSVSSSNTSVATVSPSSITFTSCGDKPTLTITPHSQGSATISLSQTGNTTGGTFDLAHASFKVNVSPPPNTAPTVSVAGVTGGASYNKGSVPTATCQVTDSEDGNSSFAATLSAITGPYASDGIGSQTASCSYTDGGGLTVSASETYNIVDPSAPSIGYTLNPVSPDGANGWYKSNVSLVWTVTENESPNSLQKTGCVDQSIIADQAEQTYSCAAISAGGEAGPVEVKVKRDGTKPTIVGSASPVANGAGWNNTNVNVSFQCDDNLSGVASCGPNQTLSSEGANPSVPGTATDNVGNLESTTVSNISIDKSKPTVSVTGIANNATYTLGSVPTAGCSTTDQTGLSGVATHATLSSSGGPVGSVTVTCSGAEDNAGNLQAAPVSVTYKVIYAWSGFFQPVDNLPTLNTVKAGSAVPVKFSLSGNQGLNILEAGYPKSIVVACDAVGQDAIEATVTAGNSSLSYDAVADQYVYVWKTDKAWAGTCRQLVVKLNDGTTIKQANFKLLK